jgi:hypothetical protein
MYYSKGLTILLVLESVLYVDLIEKEIMFSVWSLELFIFSIPSNITVRII